METETIRVLLVEDRAADALLVRHTLEEESDGFVLSRAEMLRDALACLRDEKFDLVLLDLDLPDSGGLETVLAVRRAAPRIPIVVLTGTGDEMMGQKAMEHGAQDFLMKPVSPSALIRSLRYAWTRSRLSELEQRQHDELERELRMYSSRRAIDSEPDLHEAPRVLLVEDSDIDALLMRRLLEMVGEGQFSIQRARCLEEGIAALHEASFDLVLLDLELPDSSGMATVRAVADTARAPIIVITGNEDEALGLEAVSHGAQDFLKKPPLASALLRSINYALARHRLREAVAQRRAEEQYRFLFELNPDPMWVLDPSTLKFLVVNQAMVRHYGYTQEQLLSMTAPDLHPLEEADHIGTVVRQEFWRALERHPEAASVGGMSHRRRDGSLMDVEITWSVIPFRDQRAVLACGKDVTERLRAEVNLRDSNVRLEHALENLQQAQEQVVQQERLRALGEMASGIAHDFNNALGPVVGFSDLLLLRPENLDDREKTTRYLKLMNVAARDAASIVARLREFYRQREGGEVFLPVNLRALVEQTVSLTKPRWKDQAQASGRHLEVVMNLKEVPTIIGNESELREALTNFIFNAVDAMPEGGTITLALRPSHDSVVLEVSDTGTGMTEDVRQRCLEPFFSTKGERGTGLGLAMVHGIIRRHQGSITIESELGKGTKFIVSLPVQNAERIERQREEVDSSRPLRVLVVDDDPGNQAVIVEYLIGDGHSVVAATNGREGLERFQAGAFDLVVTDRAMPEMAGDQLAVAIKALAPSKPIIMLTGFGEFMQAADELPEGVDTVVSKPVTLSELRSAVAKVVGKK